MKISDHNPTSLLLTKSQQQRQNTALLFNK